MAHVRVIMRRGGVHAVVGRETEEECINYLDRWCANRNPYELTSSCYTHRPATWRERESWLRNEAHPSRKQPVWQREGWWRNRPRELAEHYVHISNADPTMLAYTPDERHGEADRQLRTKPGRYLTKFFGPNSVVGYHALTEKQIAYFSEWWANGEPPAPKGMEKARFAITSDPDEIADVYINGPSSCMDGDHHGDPEEHPARVYGTEDLGIAYLRFDNESDQIGRHPVVARALVSPTAQVFGRIYPTNHSWHHDGFADQKESEAASGLLRSKLRELGYKAAHEVGWGMFAGCKVAKIPHSEHLNCYLMPYIDGDIGVNDAGDHFVMARQDESEHSGGETCGYFKLTAMYTCPHCTRRYNSDRVRQFTVYRAVVGGMPSDGVEWCANCANHDTWTCTGLGQRFTADVPSVQVDFQRYEQSYAERQGIFTCGYSGRGYLASMVGAPVMVNGQPWHPAHAARYSFVCAHDGQHYPLTEESVLYPGFHRSHDDLPLTQKVRKAGRPGLVVVSFRGRYDNPDVPQYLLHADSTYHRTPDIHSARRFRTRTAQRQFAHDNRFTIHRAPPRPRVVASAPVAEEQVTRSVTPLVTIETRGPDGRVFVSTHPLNPASALSNAMPRYQWVNDRTLTVAELMRIRNEEEL